MKHAVALAAVVALSGCHRGTGAPAVPANRADAHEAFVRCMFDAPPAAHDGSAMEAAVRRALRADRISFSLRAGRCEMVLEAVRTRDVPTETFNRAWDELLPLAQASAPDDIALEQAVRHIGNTYRAW